MLPENENIDEQFRRTIGEKEQQMLKAQKEKKRSAWLGLGVFGMVGWSVVVPTLAGALIGNWLDKAQPQSFSWTLALLVAGLMFGCFIAWRWVDKEHKDMHQITEEENE